MMTRRMVKMMMVVMVSAAVVRQGVAQPAHCVVFCRGC